MTSLAHAPGLAVACATMFAARPSAQVPIGDPEDDEGGIGYDDDDDEEDADDDDGENDDDDE